MTLTFKYPNSYKNRKFCLGFTYFQHFWFFFDLEGDSRLSYPLPYASDISTKERKEIPWLWSNQVSQYSLACIQHLKVKVCRCKHIYDNFKTEIKIVKPVWMKCTMLLATDTECISLCYVGFLQLQNSFSPLSLALLGYHVISRVMTNYYFVKVLCMFESPCELRI